MLKALKGLLFLNVFVYVAHILMNCKSVFYFCQLTILAQTLVVINFALSLYLNDRKHQNNIKLFLSRLHLMTIAVQICAVVGFWGIRFSLGRKFVGGQMSESIRGIIQEILSLYVHGGSLLTMLIFVRYRQIFKVSQIKQKIALHFMAWGIPFVLIQCFHWNFSGEHVYGFIGQMSWPVLIGFELFMFCLAIAFDYFVQVLHGMKPQQKQRILKKVTQQVHKFV